MSNLISSKKVLPSGPDGADILFIGEAPGYDEDREGRPFVGDTGKLFDSLLGTIGMARDQVRVTNICNYRPSNNKFDTLEGSTELEEGIKEVKEYISSRRPRWVIVLGAKPLEYILGKSGKKNGIMEWRSSVIVKDGVNYFCSLHPASVLYNGYLYGILGFDFKRFERYCTQGYTFPPHEFTIDPQGVELIEVLKEIESHPFITVDLEGRRNSFHIRCAGVGLSNSRAICFINHSGIGMELGFHSIVKRLMENPNIEKIFQNGFGYDVEVLRANGINVENYSYDTMIGAHVLEPELPYSLAFLTSIYTDEPYYKSMVRGSDDEDEKSWSDNVEEGVLWDYNCRDCITTYNISSRQHEELASRNLSAIYEYKHSLIPLSQCLTRSGMEVDPERREELKLIVKDKKKYYQSLLDAIAGSHINVKSSIHARKLFLERYKLPERRDPKTKAITFSEDAIVSYLSVIQTKIDELRTPEIIEEWEYKLVCCKCFLLIRGFRQLESNYLNIEYRANGRMYSVYNFSAATETGRGSSHKYIDGTGNNAQTWPRERLEVSEEDYNRIMKKCKPSTIDVVKGEG